MNPPAAKVSQRAELEVLIATSEQVVAQSLRNLIYHALKRFAALRFTVKEQERDLRAAVTLYEFELIVLFVNTIKYQGGQLRYAQAVELIKLCKVAKDPVVLAIVQQPPPGFAMAAEQAGVDALIDFPYNAALVAELMVNALECRDRSRAFRPAKARARRRPPRRILLLDHDPQSLEGLSKLLRGNWPDSIIVACTDSYAAWDELRRSPPDLLVTDLIHPGISGFGILERLAELKATFPIVVASGQLPEREAEARACAGSGLVVSYWGKPFDVAGLTKHLRDLLMR